MKEFVDEIQCLYAMMLEDTCGGLPSQHAKRQELFARAAALRVFSCSRMKT